MSTCLDDARLQAVADEEGTPSENEHVRACPSCGARALEARRAAEEFARGMASIAVPPHLQGRAVAGARPPGVRHGSTTLHATPAAWRPPAWALAGAAAAALVAAFVFVVLPSVDSGTRVSAAEILDRSLQALVATGTERLEYELSVTGPAGMPLESGSYRVEQLVDHDSGRWQLARYAPDGTLIHGIGENPSAGTREALVRMDGRAYRFEFTVAPNAHVELWKVQRRFAEAVLQILRAGGQVQTVDGAGGDAQYIVELPAVASEGAPAIFDVSHARVVVDAADFHIVELSASGVAVGEPVTVDYRLIRRDVRPSADVAPSEWGLPVQDAGSVTLSGAGTAYPPRDMATLLLREVARARR